MKIKINDLKIGSKAIDILGNKITIIKKEDNITWVVNAHERHECYANCAVVTVFNEGMNKGEEYGTQS